MQFAFAVHYLSGRAYAKNYNQQERPEYPPHPGRFFSALVAALHEASLGEEARSALLWLEGLDAPGLSADEVWERSHVTTYVPTNEEAHDAVPTLRAAKKQPRNFPSVALKNSVAHFIYSLNDEKKRDEFKRHERALREVASNVTYLGHSTSLVSVSLSTAPQAATHQLCEDGEIPLRVVTRGRLQELEQAYDLGLRPPAGIVKSYRRIIKALPEEKIAEGIFKDFVAFRLRGFLSIKAAAILSQGARKKVAELMGEQAETLINGRGHHPHCAFVALPHVGFEYADGHLLGWAALVHRKLENEERRAVFLALAKLKKLRFGTAGEFETELVEDDVQTIGLLERTWCQPSTVWESVTPVLFDHFPKDEKPGASAGDIIAASCRNVSLPLPHMVAVGKFSSFIGVPPASRRFFYLGNGDEPRRFAAHVILVFKEKVRGPIALGAGRHYGLGLMRPRGEQSETKGTEQ